MSPLLVLGLLTITQLLDGLTFLIATKHAGIPSEAEVNPIWEALSGPDNIIGVKLAMVIVVTSLIVYGQRKRPQMAKKVLLIACSLGLLGAAFNAFAIFQVS